MTFQVKNTRVESDTIVVFYEFENGLVHTNRFPLTANFVEIMAWGEAEAMRLEARDIELARMQEELINAPVIEEAV